MSRKGPEDIGRSQAAELESLGFIRWAVVSRKVISRGVTRSELYSLNWPKQDYRGCQVPAAPFRGPL